MLRKLSLATATIGILLAGAAGAAPGAFAKDPWPGNKCPASTITKPTIYNKAWKAGKYDLANENRENPADRGIANATDGFVGTAYLCGTSPAKKQFFVEGTVVTAGKGELIRCAAPDDTKNKYCLDQRSTNKYGGPTGDDLPDTVYNGSAKTGLWCMDPIVCGGGKQMNLTVTTAVAKTAAKCNKTTAVACFRTEILGGTIPCGSDIIWTQGANNTFKLTIYQPSCSGGFGPLYLDNVPELHICPLANDDFQADTCGDPDTQGDLWSVKNGGAGTVQYGLTTKMQKIVNGKPKVVAGPTATSGDIVWSS